jgi:hypothetical protein
MDTRTPRNASNTCMQSVRPGTLALAMAVLVSGLGTIGQAKADWAVNDRVLIRDSKSQWNKENDKRDEIQRDLNERLDSMRTLGGYSKAGDKLKEAEGDEKIPDEAPSQTQDMTVANFCKAPSSGTGVQTQQYNLCQELVKTERAQYTYAMKVYKNTQERYKAFEKIQKEREQIGNNDAGKLADNTNKLVALMTLMEIDKQQSDSYQQAYAARVAYINKSIQHLSKQAIDGNPGSFSMTGAIGQVAALGVLAGSLKELRSGKKGDN